ncbi:DUF1120 domain-containing protein [Enterobacter sp. RHBSTW-00994]|uniref:DUF1120 domain-containing protein n=1 Tax=Enterobacter sp. RHBSTW-00994 TaxID=2742676 RepID=UPI0015E93976|nr:DUF1120 domain-containing protein [Enterobacter sp. RHBSTW-00994]QLR44896.1 DUF1120 domain-containing protein [Enterobacter sp. RHBSTW-00994]
MRKIILATTLALCVNSALAASSTVLKVKGVLTNAACTPSLGNGGVVDYGVIHLADLSATEVNQLGHKDIDLTISCTAPTKVSWNLVDDREQSSANVVVEDGTFTGQSMAIMGYLYGVGTTAEGEKIGNYSLFIKADSVEADGKVVDPISQLGGYPNWTKRVNGATMGYNAMNITVAAVGSLEPLAFQTATFPLVTSLAIKDTTTLAITDDTQLDGQITISLKYL